jgi:hypothetical protein
MMRSNMHFCDRMWNQEVVSEVCKQLVGNAMDIETM